MCTAAEKKYVASDPPQARESCKQDSYLNNRKLRSYDIKDAPRGCALRRKRSMSQATRRRRENPASRIFCIEK